MYKRKSAKIYKKKSLNNFFFTKKTLEFRNVVK